MITSISSKSTVPLNGAVTWPDPGLLLGHFSATAELLFIPLPQPQPIHHNHRSAKGKKKKPELGRKDKGERENENKAKKGRQTWEEMETVAPAKRNRNLDRAAHAGQAQVLGHFESNPDQKKRSLTHTENYNDALLSTFSTVPQNSIV